MRRAIILIMLLMAWAPAWAQEPVSQEAPPPLPGQTLEAPITMGEESPMAGRRKVPLKLLESIRLGLERNVEVKKSLLDRASQSMDLTLAERLFEPEFYVKGDYGYAAENNTDTRGVGLEIQKKLRTAGQLSFNWRQENQLNRDINEDTNSATLGVTLTQPLLRGAGITVGTAEVITARNTEAQNVQSFRSSVMSLITQIQDAYWDLLLALENRISTVQSLEASQELLERNKVLIRAGRMAAADLVQTQQEVARNRVQVLDQEFEVQRVNRNLVNLLDLSEDVAVVPVEGFVFNQVKPEEKTMMRLAEEKNPELIQRRISLKQSELDMEVARSNALDEVNLEIGTSRTSSGGSPGQALDDASDLGHGWQGKLGFSIPLGLPRDRLQKRVADARRSVEKAKLDMHQSQLSVRQQVRDAVNNVNRSLRQIKLAQISRELAKQKYDIERTRLELGRSTNFQVVSYQRDLVSARDQEHSAIATYLKSLAQLDQVVGTALETWKVDIENPLPPKVPSLNLHNLAKPARLP